MIFDLLFKYGVIKANNTPLYNIINTSINNKRIPIIIYIIKVGYNINTINKINKIV